MSVLVLHSKINNRFAIYIISAYKLDHLFQYGLRCKQRHVDVRWSSYNLHTQTVIFVASMGRLLRDIRLPRSLCCLHGWPVELLADNMEKAVVCFRRWEQMSQCLILSIGDFIFFFSGFPHHLGRRNGLEYYSSTLSCPVYPLRSTPHFRRDKYPSIWHSLVSHYCVYRNTEGSYICYVLGTSYWNML